MRRKQQFGMIVLTITVVGMLIIGAGSVFAQDGNETTASNNTSQGSAGGGDGPHTVGVDDQPHTDFPGTSTEEQATVNERQGDADAESPDETVEQGNSDEGKGKAGDTTTASEDGGKAKQPSDGDDEGNGNAKKSDAADGDDTADAGNGKAKSG